MATPPDLILVAHKQLETWSNDHCSEFLGHRVCNDANRCLEVFVFLPLHILTRCLCRVWTVSATWNTIQSNTDTDTSHVKQAHQLLEYSCAP